MGQPEPAPLLQIPSTNSRTSTKSQAPTIVRRSARPERRPPVFLRRRSSGAGFPACDRACFRVQRVLQRSRHFEIRNMVIAHGAAEKRRRHSQWRANIQAFQEDSKPCTCTWAWIPAASRQIIAAFVRGMFVNVQRRVIQISKRASVQAPTPLPTHRAPLRRTGRRGRQKRCRHPCRRQHPRCPAPAGSASLSER